MAGVDALTKGIPRALVEQVRARRVKASSDEVRSSLASHFRDVKIRSGKVLDAVALGPDWAVLKVEATDPEDSSDDEYAAVAVFEDGAWKVLLNLR